MKVVFDQHVPPTLAKVFIALSKEKVIQRTCKDMIFEKAEDYAPSLSDKDYIRKSDVPWLDRFAKAGGYAVISGDKRMRQKPHERLALYDHGFVVIFFEASWADWDFFRKSSLFLHWWEEVTSKIRNAEKGTFWVIPSAFPGTGGELRNVSFGLAQLLKDNPDRSRKRQSAVAPTRRIRKRVVPVDLRQDNFGRLLGAENEPKESK